jgi:hypothetical protein
VRFVFVLGSGERRYSISLCVVVNKPRKFLPFPVVVEGFFFLQ